MHQQKTANWWRGRRRYTHGDVDEVFLNTFTLMWWRKIPKILPRYQVHRRNLADRKEELRPLRRRHVLLEHFNPDVVMEDTETVAPESGAPARDRTLAEWKEEVVVTEYETSL